MPAQQVLRIFFIAFPTVCVRRPIRFRTPPDDKIKQITLHFYGSFNANGCIAAVFSLYTSIETRRARRERTQGKSRK